MDRDATMDTLRLEKVPVTAPSAAAASSMMRYPPRLTHSFLLNLEGSMHSVVLPSGYSTCSRRRQWGARGRRAVRWGARLRRAVGPVAGHVLHRT